MRGIQGTTQNKFWACPWGKLWLRSTCLEFILTCPDFFLLCAVFPSLWMTKGNHLLIRSKYRSVKSLNYVYIFRVTGSTLLARRASCQGDLLAPYKNSLALGKRTGVLSHPGILTYSHWHLTRTLPQTLSLFHFCFRWESRWFTSQMVAAPLLYHAPPPPVHTDLHPVLELNIPACHNQGWVQLWNIWKGEGVGDISYWGGYYFNSTKIDWYFVL